MLEYHQKKYNGKNHKHWPNHGREKNTMQTNELNMNIEINNSTFETTNRSQTSTKNANIILSQYLFYLNVYFFVTLDSFHCVSKFYLEFIFLLVFLANTVCLAVCVSWFLFLYAFQSFS